MHYEFNLVNTGGSHHALRPVVGADGPRAGKRFMRDSGSMDEYRINR